MKFGLEEPAQKMGHSFASGKFDLNQASALPLAAFSAAVKALTQYIVASDKLQIIQGELKSALEDFDMVRIMDALPGCEDLFTSKGSFRHSSSISNRQSVTAGSLRAERTAGLRMSFGGKEAINRLQSFGGKEAVLRLQHAICVMLKTICSNLKGLVLFIDDLQWSDVSTIELLRSIAVRKDIPSLLIVGAYRDDEVTDSHPLMIHIKDNKDYGIRTTTLQVGNLSCHNVKSLIAEALRMEGNEDAVNALATTIHKKTDGVAFYVLVFLKSIYDQDLLEFNFGLMKWVWDEEKVDARLVTENVTTILINKLKQHDEESQKVLQVASCLGATFSTPMVAMIVDGLSSEELTEVSLTDDDDDEEGAATEVAIIIAALECDGLIETERGSSTRYRFCHDKIQSAAFMLIPAGRRNSLRGEIGDILMQKLDPEELEENLFTVVSLRNCNMAALTSTSERQELAKMNLTAGLMASKTAAFDVALSFYRTGRKLLEASGWETDTDTMLQLFSNEAKACLITGDLDTMDKLVGEVLSKNVPVADKFVVYEVKITAANSAQRFQEALTTAIEVRRQLGLTCPSNKPISPFVVLKEYIKTSRMLGKRSPEDIANLPLLEDKRIAMGQRILMLMMGSAIYAQPTMYPILVFLQVRTSVKHGIDKSSCNAFATFGVLLCGAFGKFERGREMAKAVDLLLENPDHRSMQSMCMFICENFIYHWTSPIQATFAPLLSGYQKGE